MRKNFRVELLKHSVNQQGKEILTWSLEYPRYIHSELMTHRVFSRNTASSRAVPVARQIEFIKSDPAMPIFWGRNKSGMQSEELLSDYDASLADDLWLEWRDVSIKYAETLGANDGLNVHKQWANRPLEAFQMHKAIVTSTEWYNFYELRTNKEAQPDIRQLALEMLKIHSESNRQVLQYGQWHLPYIDLRDDKYYSGEQEVDLETAKKISVSCCAQVSYRRLDQSVDKAIRLYDQFVNSKPRHASPFEHQAMASGNQITKSNEQSVWKDGVTHVDRWGWWWSGNFQGWIQLRQLIEQGYNS